MTLLVSQIQETVARHYGLSKRDLLGDSRAQRYARPRQIAITLAFEFAPRVSTTLMGRLFRRDHTTCLHASDRVAYLTRKSPDIARELAELRAKLQLMESAAAAREISDVWERFGEMVRATKAVTEAQAA